MADVELAFICPSSTDGKPDLEARTCRTQHNRLQVGPQSIQSVLMEPIILSLGIAGSRLTGGALIGCDVATLDPSMMQKPRGEAAVILLYV